MHRISIGLRRQGPFPDEIWPLYIYHFTVYPSTQQLRIDAAPPIPAHALRLLPSHTLVEAISGLPSRFHYTLAKHLGKGHHCIPLLSALSFGGCFGIIYHVSTTRRQLLFDELRED